MKNLHIEVSNKINGLVSNPSHPYNLRIRCTFYDLAVISGVIGIGNLSIAGNGWEKVYGHYVRMRYSQE
jgi:hypothetical protein